MDLNQQFGLYEEYVKATLTHFPVDQTKLNCIAVFKALAELTDEQKLNGAEFITREMLQARVSERYAANANARRQEVNKYLSQRFRISSDIEPDFVQFMLEDDSTVYSRADNVDPGSKRTAYRIADFPKKDKLIALLRRLDLTLYRLPKSELTLQGIFAAYLGAFWPYSPMQKWHGNYAQFTRKLRGTDQITDEQLTQLWGKQSNGIALIKQGVTPAKEVVSAKKHLLKITSLLKNLSNNNRYQESLGIMDKASEDNSISRRYFSVLNRAAVAFDSANLTFPVDSNTMLKFVRFMNDAFNLNIDCKQADWYELSTNLKKAVAGYLAEDVDPLKVNIVLWRINDQQDALKNLLSEQPQMNEPIENNNSQGENKVNLMSEPLNQILYGPPGTGKTYHTIEAAVKAAEPKFKWHNRDELKTEYDRLVAEKRIRFVTFHQSYGYEEFVEGLKAKTTEDMSIEYVVENGAFKSIADDAKSTAFRKSFEVSSDATIWKISIDGTGKSEVSNHCLANGVAAIGWGDSGNLLSEKLENNEYYQKLGPQVKSSLSEFSQRAAIGDLILCIGSQRTVQAVGVISGDYHYEPEGTSIYRSYCNQLPVNWLVTDIQIDFHALNNGVNFTQKTFYELWRFSVADVFELLSQNDIHIGSRQAESCETENYVLIIDEINRGNISKIFGELITLIEPSKRSGYNQKEALTLNLPYSGKPFSVPNNLHIIGTMNTADRSLALMDTALRRRFDFVEMMPDPSVLRGVVIKGIDLETMLQTLNERIEILYDREHTLGHVFFIPVRNLKDEGKEEEAFAKLVSVFQNKVIPLLQEYFFEDWQKIRLVLGDNQRETDLQFIDETTLNDQKLNALFGKGHELNLYGDAPKNYKLKPFNDDVWTLEETYIGIYQTPQTKRELK